MTNESAAAQRDRTIDLNITIEDEKDKRANDPCRKLIALGQLPDLTITRAHEAEGKGSAMHR